MITVTYEQLQKIYRNQKPEVLKATIPALNLVLQKYKINENKNEVASFLAQVGHESAEMNFRKENLNYSAEGLLKVFKKYFTPAEAAQYARKAEKIANRVYANRMGNGNEASGDGFKFRGRSGIQITGRNNYTAFANAVGKSVNDAVVFLESEQGFWEGAGWFWQANGLDKFDDDLDIRIETQKINGGYNGLPDRQKLFERAQAAL